MNYLSRNLRISRDVIQLTFFQADNGTLEVEEHIKDESRMWVHKKFGTSKRISELDKKQIVSFVALKTQASKESCRRQLQKVMVIQEVVRVQE